MNLEKFILDFVDDDIKEYFENQDRNTCPLEIPLKIHIARHLAIISNLLKDKSHNSNNTCDNRGNG